MFKIMTTLIRGRSHDLVEAAADAQALPLLRQQIRDAAAAHEAARQAVALTMTQSARERAAAERLDGQRADLTVRALAALEAGREDLAAEAAGSIAQLEAEAETSARTLAAFDAEVASLRRVLAEGEARLRALQRGQRLAVAVETTQRMQVRVAPAGGGALDDAEATLDRLQAAQARTEATRAALAELSVGTNAEAVRDRLAAAGCGPALRPDAASVLARLKAQAAQVSPA